MAISLHRFDDGSAALVDAAGRRYLVLNESGAFVCAALRGGMSAAAITDALAGAFDVDPREARADVDALLDRLRSDDFLEEGP